MLRKLLITVCLWVPMVVFGQPFLELETVVDVDRAVYPGERFLVGYRYFYSGNLTVTQEDLPLLKLDGLHPIGELQVRELSERGVNVQEVLQLVEAMDPGSVSFGSSVAHATTDDGEEIVAKADGGVIQVSDFPEEGKPPSFYGAVGSFIMDVKLQGEPQVGVGDVLDADVMITGTEGLHTVRLPKWSCNPGISGLFETDPLPPVGRIDGNSKRFPLPLSPLSTVVKEIPPLFFSYFDAGARNYTILASAPIPIQVEEKGAPASTIAEGPSWKEELLKPKEITGESLLPLTHRDLQPRPFSSWWTLLLFPCTAFALFVQLLVKRKQEKIR